MAEIPDVQNLSALTGYLDAAGSGQSEAEAAQVIIAQHDALQRGVQRLSSQSVAIRGVASAWILGSLSAAGLVLKEAGAFANGADLNFTVALVLAVIGFAAVAGLLLLWGLDRRFNYRLLDSAFVLGIALEREHPRLLAPASRLMSKATHSNIVHWFYLLPAVGFFLAGSALSCFALVDRPAGSAARFLIAGTVVFWVVVLAFLVFAIVKAVSKKQPIDDVVEKWHELREEVRAEMAKQSAEPGSAGSEAGQ